MFGTQNEWISPLNERGSERTERRHLDVQVPFEQAEADCELELPKLQRTSSETHLVDHVSGSQQILRVITRHSLT